MAKYTLQVVGGSNAPALCKDGTAMECPFQAPLMMQSNLGSPQMLRLPCNTNCPLMRVEIDNVKISCGKGSGIYFIIEESGPKKPAMGIISK